MRFVGRAQELEALTRLLPTPGTEAPGRAVLVRGRRRVGKSTLIEKFLGRTGAPSVFFTASRQPMEAELVGFWAEVLDSDLPSVESLRDTHPSTWDAALRLLADHLPEDRPTVLVLDELPYLADADGAFEGALQKAFDRHLSRKPVLLVGVGSDVSMMEALNEYGRPFHQRATEMVIGPLNPAEVGDLLGLAPADAVDAYLVTGGLPLVCAEWHPGVSMWDYLAGAVSSSTSALVVSGERSLAAEFPTGAHARAVLTAIGDGETTFAKIAQSTGVPQSSLARALAVLTDKRVVAADQPLSTRRSSEPRYRVADPHLRFWLPFLGPYLPEIERGRGERTLARIRGSWPTWCGRAVEPVVRDAVDRLAPDLGFAGTPVVGGYWTRSNNVEIDLVLADRAPVARTILAAGSVKWGDHFTAKHLGDLVTHRRELPGATDDTPLIAVTRTGAPDLSGVTHLDANRLITAWTT